MRNATLTHMKAHAKHEATSAGEAALIAGEVLDRGFASPRTRSRWRGAFCQDDRSSRHCFPLFLVLNPTNVIGTY